MTFRQPTLQNVDTRLGEFRYCLTLECPLCSVLKVGLTRSIQLCLLRLFSPLWRMMAIPVY